MSTSEVQPEAHKANTACTSKLQLQMHLGEKPYAYCSKVLAITSFLCYGRAQLLRQSKEELCIVG